MSREWSSSEENWEDLKVTSQANPWYSDNSFKKPKTIIENGNPGEWGDSAFSKLANFYIEIFSFQQKKNHKVYEEESIAHSEGKTTETFWKIW